MNYKNKTMTIFKKWTLAVAVVMVALFTACQNDPTNFFTQDYTVTQNDWQVSNDASGMYYFCQIREPKLTQSVYNKGLMQAFLYTTDNGYNISPLPFNDYWIDDTGYMYTEQITCEFLPGYITFIVKSSDHAQVLPYYGKYDFKVQFAW